MRPTDPRQHAGVRQFLRVFGPSDVSVRQRVLGADKRPVMWLYSIFL